MTGSAVELAAAFPAHPVQYARMSRPGSRNNHFGLLNINKPKEITSRDVVDRVQRVGGRTKTGHAGTIDPLGTGVLIVGLGRATRLIEYVQRLPKQYRATFLLGRESDTEDVDGKVTVLTDPPQPSLQEITDAAEALQGHILQRPPAYSALRIEGRRAYRLARAGEQVDLAPREVVVHRIEVTGYDYPELSLEVECGSGTYIRSLGRDLAHSLGTAAVMSAIERTAIGHFRLADAVDLADLCRENLADHLLPAQEALVPMPQISLSAEEQALVGNGRPIIREDLPPDVAEFAAIDGGRLTAILARRPDGTLGPTRNFPES
ncbi:MAG: tRNA pseudouridine(55) synthase TruB [Planctomycetes bacterium]|nr:tRNA pseudouridine(55) synthase TruB [Planctomycetota bacterium]